MTSVQKVWKTFLKELRNNKTSRKVTPHCYYLCFEQSMVTEAVSHKENKLLQRGIFSSVDFAAFQKSEV